MHSEQGADALANLPDPGKVVTAPTGAACGRWATKRVQHAMRRSSRRPIGWGSGMAGVSKRNLEILAERERRYGPDDPTVIALKKSYAALEAFPGGAHDTYLVGMRGRSPADSREPNSPPQPTTGKRRSGR